MIPQKAQEIMKQTRDGYNRIAAHFSLTRHKFWADGELFARYVNEGDRVLDAGCGTGRLAPFIIKKNAQYTGCDNAETIIDIAREQYADIGADFVVADITQLPCKENTFDTVFCLAALHHIPSQELRITVMHELYRVAKKRVVLTVWNLYANYYRKKFNLINDQLADGDMTIPWYSADGTLLMHRYIHAFTKDECEDLARAAGFVIDESNYINERKKATIRDGHNLMLVLTKPS